MEELQEAIILSSKLNGSESAETHTLYFLLGDLLRETENKVGSTASFKCYLKYLSFWYDKLVKYFELKDSGNGTKIDKSILVEVSNNFSVLRS